VSEHPIAISNLNDFIFCPVSIYYHSLDIDSDTLLFQDVAQLNGSHAHKAIDGATYSTRKSILQGMTIYSEQYNLTGKIDVFDEQTGILTERKKKIKTIYDGYVFQLYAQYFCLEEMGYCVNELRLYSISDNKVYKIVLPKDNLQMYQKFIQLLEDMNRFAFKNFRQENNEKCFHCIYEPLCCFSALKEE